MKRNNFQKNYKMPEISIFGFICISFLVAVFFGALMAICTPVEAFEEVSFFVQVIQNTIAMQNFFIIFYKYMKYILMIWLGAFFRYGLLISGVIFLFRGISIGYTSSSIFLISGISGILDIFTSFFLPNICFILAYFITMYGTVDYGVFGTKKNTRYGINRIIWAKYTKYITIFCVSTLLILFGIVVEIFMNK